MRKAIHAQDDRKEAVANAGIVDKNLVLMKPKRAAKLLQAGVERSLDHAYSPREHWQNINNDNPLERILRELRRRPRVVGAFPEGHSALMPVVERLRHIARTRWRTKKHLNMGLFEHAPRCAALAEQSAKDRRHYSCERAWNMNDTYRDKAIVSNLGE